MTDAQVQQVLKAFNTIVDNFLAQIPCFAGPTPAVWTDTFIARLRKKGLPDLYIPILMDIAAEKGSPFTATATSNQLYQSLYMKFPPSGPGASGPHAGPVEGYHPISKDEVDKNARYRPPQLDFRWQPNANPNSQGLWKASETLRKAAIRNGPGVPEVDEMEPEVP